MCGGNTMRTYEQWIEKVKEALDNGFYSKASKKDAMHNLRTAFDIKQDELDKELWAIAYTLDKRIEGHFRVATTQLHHFKPEHVDFYAKHLPNHANLNDLLACLEIRDEIKSAEIGVRQKSEDQLIKEEEQLVARAVKDNGFRTTKWIDHQIWDCRNDHGTEWLRVDWYLRGKRTAFHKCRAEVGKEYRFWESKGSPNMKGWGYMRISEFYENCA